MCIRDRAERDGGQEEVPQQKDVMMMAGEMKTHIEHGAAPKTGKQVEQKNTTGHAIRYER